MPDQHPAVGIVGLGTMGAGMARNMRRHGVPLHVFDADPRVAGAFSVEGFSVAESVGALGQACDVVVLMLPHPDVTLEVVTGRGGLVETMRPGTIVVDTSTDGPGPVRLCAEVLSSAGIRMIDAPVGRGVPEAAHGELMMLVGGASEDLEDVRWLLEILGSEIVHCGPIGAGQVVKVVNNLVSVGNVALVAEAHALAAKAGVDNALVFRVLGSTAADSWQLRNALERRLPEMDFSLGFKMDLARKDLQLSMQMAKDLGYSGLTAVAEAALQWHDEGVRLGLGDLDQCALLAVGDPALMNDPGIGGCGKVTV